MVTIKNFFSLIVVLLLTVPNVKADTQFRLIVDASGSMLISDPDKLTSESLKLISNLAPEERASLGVWLFGERPRVLLPEAMVNPSTKQRLNNAVEDYVPGDLKTDLESIIRMLLQTPDDVGLAPEFDRHWILVTDGMVDVSLDEKVNEASRQRIMTDLASALSERGIHLHTVSMSNYTDKELLQSVSTLTNATHTEVASPEALLDTFDRIFSQAAPSEEVPFEDNHFFIDEAIEEATLLVFHKEGLTPTITQPSGQPLNMSASNVSVAKAAHYTLVTITKPKVGTWEVKDVDLERSNVRVITKLSAQATKIAPVIFVNEPIYSTVGLFQDRELIKDTEFLDLIDVTQRLNLLSGESETELFKQSVGIANSQFKNKVDKLTDTGNYELISEVDGKTFVRKLSQFFSVVDPIKVTAQSQDGGLVMISAKPTNMRLNSLRSNARLIMTFKDGSEEQVEMPLLGEGYWQKIFPVPPNDAVTAYVRLIGITRTGVRFEYSSDVWTLSRQGAERVQVQQGRDSSLVALSSAAAVNRDLMPVVVTPQISVVTEEEIEEQAESEAAAAPEKINTEDDNQTDVDTLVTDEATLDKTDWLFYAVLNGAGLLIVGGGYFIFHRIRKKRKQQEINDSDV
ncbi:vWA domain-containing protein [Marinomonas piezotolerans]|uniref:vWA domain-containing protein n=1 Tax=Marinomonas piezotolerans TaxID=2213058 RepID=UPI001FE7D34A|nr:vWA domain-containing protein [Marinomonas piezotolerans]